MGTNNYDKHVNEIKDKLKNVDQEQLKLYIELLDRFLLYNMIAAHLPQEAINTIIKAWERSIKMSIDFEVRGRTKYLESTPEGRAAKLQKVPDGEEFRLNSLEVLNVAKSLALAQLQKPESEGPTEEVS